MSIADAISRRLMAFSGRSGAVNSIARRSQDHLPHSQLEGRPSVSHASSTYPDTAGFTQHRERVLLPESDTNLARRCWSNEPATGSVFVELQENGCPRQPGLTRPNRSAHPAAPCGTRAGTTEARLRP